MAPIQNFSKRNLKSDNWESLLRKGIRGASISEIKKLLHKNILENNKLEILEPCNLGLKDRVDLWDKETTTTCEPIKTDPCGKKLKENVYHGHQNVAFNFKSGKNSKI